MRYIIALLYFTLVSVGVNGWITNYRDKIPAQFELLRPTNPEQLHEFRIALKQRNVDILEATLLDVSNPESNNYGKWWTSDKILDLIAPSEESIQPVISWLKSHPISKLDVSGRDFIKVVARIEVVESMFNTEMYDFRSKETGRIVARVFGSVNVPDDLMEVIEMVTGLTELVPKSKIGLKHDTHTMKAKRQIQQLDPLGSIFPGLLRAMYNIPSEFAVHTNSSVGFVEFDHYSSFNFADVKDFNQAMNENVVVAETVGPFDGGSDNEATAQVQYGGAIALNTTTWYWTVENWMYEFAVDIFIAEDYPLVVSMPWGWPEGQLCEIMYSCPTNSTKPSYDYVNRVNVEFVKVVLKGITLVAASGDLGAPGVGNDVCNSNLLSNSFPASSPWVTAVGATMLITDPGTKNLTLNFPPACSNVYCARTKHEGACTISYTFATMTSGGGFSDLSSTPRYQREQLRSYLNSGVPLPTGLFDPTKRAYPDVAVNGHNYIILDMGEQSDIDGTSSASSPVFAAMIALLNSVMLNNGQQPLGFVNPLLYKMAADDPSTFTDITIGNNDCNAVNCCVGFVATTGWDPVTGLGTPVFSRMQSYIQKTLIK